MKKKSHFDLDEKVLEVLTRAELVSIILDQREKLNGLKREREDQKNKQINQQVNQPSSKKPEWDKDGNPGKPGKPGKPGRIRCKSHRHTPYQSGSLVYRE